MEEMSNKVCDKRLSFDMEYVRFNKKICLYDMQRHNGTDADCDCNGGVSRYCHIFEMAVTLVLFVKSAALDIFEQAH
jgi:hypothetical protein